MAGCKRGLEWLKDFWALRSLWMVGLAFLSLLPLPVLVHTQEARCAYVVLVMAMLWLTESLPMAATALLPVFLFPMTGVLPAKQVSKNYITDTSMLFIGGLMVAVAVEEWNLHKRIALGVLRIVGANPMWLMLGLMVPTWFLSMWISNTATTAMMLPIVSAVLTQLRDPDPAATSQEGSPAAPAADAEIGCPAQDGVERSPAPQGEADKAPTKLKGDVANGVGHIDTMPGEKSIKAYDVKQPADVIQTPAVLSEEEDVAIRPGDTPEFQRLGKGMSLCIAYASNIGGIATLTGTPPNLVLKGQVDELYAARDADSGLTFASWMVLGFPLSLLMLLLAWLLILVVFIRRGCCGITVEKKTRVKAAILQEYRKMGRITMAEVELLVAFVLLGVLFLSRNPRFAPGWGVAFREAYVSDSTSAIFVAALLYMLPARIPNVFCWKKRDGEKRKPYTPLLTWGKVQERLPWGVIMLLGGGFALADACKQSGLSTWLGRQLASFGHLGPVALNAILCAVVAGMTEVTSNTASATLLLPIMAQLAIEIRVNPLYLMFSTAIATSLAFMLPVATPPNAVVFSHGYLSIPDMAGVGLVMNVISVACVTLAVNTWGEAFFHFSQLPEAFRNATV